MMWRPEVRSICLDPRRLSLSLFRCARVTYAYRGKARDEESGPFWESGNLVRVKVPKLPWLSAVSRSIR